MSALLGLAMLAMPVAAEAHSWDYYRHRAAFPAYNRTAGFRSMVDRPMAFAPPMLADNRPFMGSAAPMMPVRNYYGGGGCAMPAAPAYNAYAPAYNSYAPAYNPYANAYQPAYMPAAGSRACSGNATAPSIFTSWRSSAVIACGRSIWAMTSRS
jgi:hypothetical protein